MLFRLRVVDSICEEVIDARMVCTGQATVHTWSVLISPILSVRISSVQKWEKSADQELCIQIVVQDGLSKHSPKPAVRTY